MIRQRGQTSSSRRILQRIFSFWQELFYFFTINFFSVSRKAKLTHISDLIMIFRGCA